MFTELQRTWNRWSPVWIVFQGKPNQKPFEVYSNSQGLMFRCEPTGIPPALLTSPTQWVPMQERGLAYGASYPIWRPTEFHFFTTKLEGEPCIIRGTSPLKWLWFRGPLSSWANANGTTPLHFVFCNVRYLSTSTAIYVYHGCGKLGLVSGHSPLHQGKSLV